MPEKIVYFMDHYSNLGGAANTLLRQAVLMKRAGKKVSVVVSTWGQMCEDYLRLCDKEGIPVYELCFTVTNQPEGVDILSVLENYDGIKNFLKECLPDIVHSVQLNPTVELACRELNIPHIMNIYQAMPAFFRFEYADVFPSYHICDSLYYADFWKQHLGTASYCIRTVAEGENRNRYLINQKILRFVCIGLLCERKNQLEVIKAFEIAVVCHGLCGKLQLFGHTETPYAELCRQYIIEKELQDYIEIKGFSRNMEEVYHDSDILICGSTSESYPNVISEALAHGLIVVSTPVAGVPEVIKDKENGYLCKGYSAGDIAECIQEVSRDVKAGDLDKILENACAVYTEVHSPNAVTSKLLNCYEEVLVNYKVENSYGIDEFKEEFGEFIDRFHRHQDYFTNLSYVRTNLWKIYYVIQFLNKQREEHSYYIWGTGKYGRVYKEILDTFAPDLIIAGYIDSYAKGQYMGYEVIEPEEVLKDDSGIILVGIITKRDEIFDFLNDNNFEYNDDYFTFDPIGW